MREILFRAKEISTDKWVEGYLVKISEDDYRIATEEDINWSYTKLGDYDGVMTCVNPETICQYTGLTDKNGNKIWENDVVFCKQYIGGNQIDYHIEKGYVEIKHGAFGLHRFKPDAYYRPFKDWLEDYEYEVIGNIFDNPELLENE